MPDLKPTTKIPDINVDLFSDSVLLDPYPHYRRLRDLGPVVRLEPSGMYALSRFADVREALGNREVFSSAEGIAMNEDTNSKIKGNTDALGSRRYWGYSAPRATSRLMACRGFVFSADPTEGTTRSPVVPAVVL